MSRQLTITCDECKSVAIHDDAPEVGALKLFAKDGWHIHSTKGADLCPMCNEVVQIACEWSDYRKSYGVSAEHLNAAHKAFQAGWAAAKGKSHEPGPLR